MYINFNCIITTFIEFVSTSNKDITGQYNILNGIKYSNSCGETAGGSSWRPGRRNYRTNYTSLYWLSPWGTYEGDLASQKFSEVLRSSEASSQKFSEYIQNGCLEEAKLSKRPSWGRFAAPKKLFWVVWAFVRQPFWIYSENFWEKVSDGKQIWELLRTSEKPFTCTLRIHSKGLAQYWSN